MMGWFSNPDCPRCGRETTIGTDGLFETYYECRPCRQKAMKEHKEKKELESRITRLEQQLKDQ